MVWFWQLSGPDSHIARRWEAGNPGKPVGNARIASLIFHSMSRKVEDGGEQVIDLVLGFEPSGASHVLLPADTSTILPDLKRYKDPYPPSRFTSLSPICVGRDTFQSLLEDRQVVSKATVSSKIKGDNSKANQAFWGGPPRPARAAFEHGRCFWRILHQELNPQFYGLPDAPWSVGLDFISLAINLWSADKSTFLDAGITCIHLPTGSGSNSEERTLYLKSKNCEVLRNPNQSTMTHLPETWDTIEVDDSDIGKKINEVMELHSNPNGSPPAPLILLVHDYPMVKAFLENLGIQTSKWKYELEELLGLPLQDGIYSQRTARDSKHSRDRSRSPPRAGSSKVHHSRETRSPAPMQSYAPVYVVDTMAMYKAMTGVGGHPSTIRPVNIFNEITFNKELDYVCGGSDSNYIMQSWRTMVTGKSIDEQKEFFRKSSETLLTQRDTGPEATPATYDEDEGLYETAKSEDLFNEGGDSDDDYEVLRD